MPVAIFDPAQAWPTQLVTLNQNWSAASNQATPGIFTTLAINQYPQILWLGCSDSRVPETSLLGLNPGEVFTHRNIANLVHPSDTSFPAVLDYAVEHVGVTHIIICGHTGCGGVKASLSAGSSGSSSVDSWLVPIKAIKNNHQDILSGFPAGSADQIKALAKLSVQHSMAMLRNTKTVSEATKPVTVHGALYDLSTGLISFLSGADELEPAGLRLNTTDITRMGTFASAGGSQTETVLFATPYSKPPRIVLGLSSLDVNCHHDNPRMTVLASNITTTGFQVAISTWGSTLIQSAKCVWLEIPDDDDYADFQTGTFATNEDHPWNNWRMLTQRQVTFTKPYTSPPNVVMWLNGFDSPQNSAGALNVYASNITTTGFTINHDGLNGKCVFGQWCQWVAFPVDNKFGVTTSPVGANTMNGVQSNAGTLAFNNLGNAATATKPSAVVAGLSSIEFLTGDSFRASVALANPTASTVDWTVSSWSNSYLGSCQGQCIIVP